MPLFAATNHAAIAGVGRFLKDLGPNMFYENAFDYGISAPFLKGKLPDYKPRNLLNFLGFSAIVGSATYLVGDVIESKADKYFLKGDKFEGISAYLKNPMLVASKHPKALTALLASLGVVAGYQHFFGNKKEDK